MAAGKYPNLILCYAILIGAFAVLGYYEGGGWLFVAGTLCAGCIAVAMLLLLEYFDMEDDKDDRQR